MFAWTAASLALDAAHSTAYRLCPPWLGFIPDNHAIGQKSGTECQLETSTCQSSNKTFLMCVNPRHFCLRPVLVDHTVP